MMFYTLGSRSRRFGSKFVRIQGFERGSGVWDLRLFSGSKVFQCGNWYFVFQIISGIFLSGNSRIRGLIETASRLSDLGNRVVEDSGSLVPLSTLKISLRDLRNWGGGSGPPQSKIWDNFLQNQYFSKPLKSGVNQSRRKRFPGYFWISTILGPTSSIFRAIRDQNGHELVEFGSDKVFGRN